MLEIAPGEKGAEEHYDLSDALGAWLRASFVSSERCGLRQHTSIPCIILAVASWLNVFVRKADVVKIACIAQSVNVISPVRLGFPLLSKKEYALRIV
jgi:alpha-N-arabinofuranosidase